MFAGDAKAVNNRVAADLKGRAFIVFYAADASGAVTVTGGHFLVQTTHKDRSPLVVGGGVVGGDTINVRSNGWIPIRSFSRPVASGGSGT